MGTDWQLLITDLVESGWTRKAIAERCCVPYTTLCDVANGSSVEPRGMFAVRLYQLRGKKPAPQKQAA